jgi:hypothetical protein
LDEERQAAHNVVDSVNRSHSERWGIHFKLLGWESVVPGYIRPQSKINEDLDRCSYFIGVLWDKWGSKPSADTDDYTSGFEEEYYRAKEGIESGHMRDMAIYFKKIEVPSGMKPGEEIQKVFDFKQKCIDEHKVFFKEFSNIHDFEDRIREKLEEIGWRETLILTDEDQQAGQSKKTPSSEDSPDEPTAENTLLLDEGVRDFLQDLAHRSTDWDATSSYDVARLRLIGTAVNRSGNDDFYLGNHDANLIFREFREQTLSEREVRALIDCGVVGFEHHNVPLWRWLSKKVDGADIWERVRLLAVFGNQSEKRNAFDILRLGSQSLDSFEGLATKKDECIKLMLSEDMPSQVFDAAISFLASGASEADVTLLEKTAVALPQYRRAKMEEAIVSVLSRTSVDAAVKRLVEKEVDKVDEALTEVLFGSPQSLTTDTVQLCLSAKPETIRVRAVKLLFERDEITLGVAQTLLTDSNHEVRLLAAESFKKLGQELSEEVVKKALVKRDLSFVSAFTSKGKTSDETYYEQYCLNRLMELDLPTLKVRAKAAGIFDIREVSALYRKYPNEMRAEITGNLQDCFKGHLEKRIQQAREAGSLDPKLEGEIRSIDSFLRRRLCTQALSALCRMRNSKDLQLARKVIKRIEVDATEDILAYFSRFGGWSDIELVKKLGFGSDEKRSWLSLLSVNLPDQRAATIISLGKDRTADMLALELDSAVRASLAKQLPKRLLGGLRDEVLLRELDREGDGYRAVFALRCVQALPKSRIKSLLDRYIDSDEHRYYNSVHWLDLGAALPTAVAQSVAKRALSHQ